MDLKKGENIQYFKLSINLIFDVSELPSQDEAEESCKLNKWGKYKESRVEQPLCRPTC